MRVSFFHQLHIPQALLRIPVGKGVSEIFERRPRRIEKQYLKLRPVIRRYNHKFIDHFFLVRIHRKKFLTQVIVAVVFGKQQFKGIEQRGEYGTENFVLVSEIVVNIANFG